MYQVADGNVLAKGGRALLRRGTSVRISKTVIFLGLTSMLTDVSSEMVTAVLPLYLIYSLGLSPLQFGVIDGIQGGAAGLVRVLSGFAADRFGRYKEMAVLGYGLSAFCRIGLLVVGRSWALLGAIVFIDRTGKGIRTAPRDAMISLSSDPDQLGTAFGVHRAMDTAGAVIGPLIAFGMLVVLPQGFHSIFFVSFCFALIGLAVLVLFVQNPAERKEARAAKAARDEAPPLTWRTIASLLAVPQFAAVIAAAGALALATMSDGFVYLGLQKNLGFGLHDLPLLYVATSVVYMALAVPVGRLADRVGFKRVFVLGYLLLLVVYAALVIPGIGSAASLVVILAFGAYYAATDGILAALSSSLLPEDVRASGLSLVMTATSLARLFASVLFGAIWVLVGVRAAVAVFAVGIVLAAIFAAYVLNRYGTSDAVDA
jgi:MFS family permease